MTFSRSGVRRFALLPLLGALLTVGSLAHAQSQQPAAEDAELTQLEQKARELYALDKLLEAGRVYRQLAERAHTPQDRQRFLINAAWLQHQAGDPQADASLEMLFQLDVDHQLDPALYSESFLERAEAARQQVLRLREQQLQMELLEIQTLIDGGQIAQARARLEPLVAEHADNASVLWTRARLARATDDLPTMVSIYSRLAAVKALPAGVSRSNLLGALGKAQLDLGDDAAAAETLQKATSFEDPLLSSWQNLGLALQRLGRTEDAVRAYQSAHRLAPGDRSVLEALCALLLGQNRFEAIETLLTDTLSASPANGSEEAESQLWLLLGRAQRGNQHLEQAVRSLRQALQLNPDVPQAGTILGLTLLDLEQPEAACSWVEQALGRTPRDASLLQVQGLCRLALNDPSAAVSSLEQARELAPDRSDVANNLGRALYEAGKLEDAAAAFESALALDPDLETARSNLEIAREALARYGPEGPPPSQAAQDHQDQAAPVAHSAPSSDVEADSGATGARATERAVRSAATAAKESKAGTKDKSRSSRTTEVAAQPEAPGIDLRPGTDPTTGWSALEVLALTPGGPAQRAGLAVGDWILRVDGERDLGATQLMRRLQELGAGQSVRLDCTRDGKPLSIDFVVSSG